MDKVLFITNLPAPYRVDFFNEFGKYCNLTVVFERKNEVGRDSNWISDNFTNFKAVFLGAKEIGAGNSISFKIIDIVKQNYDQIIVGVYSTLTAMVAISYMKAKRIPFIISSDGGRIKHDAPLIKRIKKHFIGSASAWLSTGNVTSKYLEYYGASADKIFTYPFTSVQKEDVLIRTLTTEEKEKYKEKIGVKEETIILSVGQFIHRKGYDVLLRALDKLKGNVGVYVVGGQATEEYIQLKESLKLDDVHFVGFKNKIELRDYYLAADIFVLPTREDIWGLVINEAMSYGLPVITTDKCVAGLEMINDGCNGYIVRVEDEDQLGEKIQRLVDDPELRKCMSAECLNTAQKYTIENMAKTHVQVFDAIKNI